MPADWDNPYNTLNFGIGLNSNASPRRFPTIAAMLTIGQNSSAMSSDVLVLWCHIATNNTQHPKLKIYNYICIIIIYTLPGIYMYIYVYIYIASILIYYIILLYIIYTHTRDIHIHIYIYTYIIFLITDIAIPIEAPNISALHAVPILALESTPPRESTLSVVMI